MSLATGKRAIAYGAGLVGRYVCWALQDAHLTVVERDQSTLDSLSRTRGTETWDLVCADAFEHARKTDLSQFDLVLNMLPGRVGGRFREFLIDCGTRVVDIAFSDDIPEVWEIYAVDSGTCFVHDVGIAPGLSNMLLERASDELGPLKSATIKVGGNPTEPDDGWSYMAPFSPTDVIEEYTRPARVIQGGEIVTLEALSQRHLIEVEGHGTMEAFLTDGLRSLLTSEAVEGIETLEEYTVRWPGHIDKFIEMRDSGTEGHIDEETLLEEWKFDHSRGDFTWMEVAVEAYNGERARWVYDLVRHDEAGWQTMTKSTGFVTLFVARTLLDDSFYMEQGVFAPEDLGDDFHDRVFDAFDQFHPGVLQRIE
uniref:Saccharopine reductase n=1 Tax=uncultured marine group II/III euryarchaeote KM3_27_D02 TaxID=1456428 RepID=A0A075GWB0_9EURY|nr:saccharopine reductase [uncultured marine group II/III euryarchaeote KM3_27_D02]